MLRIKNCKLVLVLAMVITLLFPYATPVLAATDTAKKVATYTQDDLTTLGKIPLKTTRFVHGTEYTFKPSNGESGKTNSEKHLNQIVVYNNEGIDRTNTIYCVDAEKGMPASDNSTIYENLGDFFNKNSSDTLKKFIEELEKKEQKDENTDAYNAICWIAQNAYLEFQKDIDGKNLDNYLTRVYGQFFEVNKNEIDGENGKISALDFIKENITLDDINMIQQAAIWYFSNPGYLPIAESKNESEDNSSPRNSNIDAEEDVEDEEDTVETETNKQLQVESQNEEKEIESSEESKEHEVKNSKETQNQKELVEDEVIYDEEEKDLEIISDNLEDEITQISEAEPVQENADDSKNEIIDEYGYSKETNLKDVKTAYELTSLEIKVPKDDKWEADPDYTGEQGERRKSAMNMLLSYLIVNAKKAKEVTQEDTSTKYPEFDDKVNSKFDFEEIDGKTNYKFGPFSIKVPENGASNCNLKIFDYTDSEKEIQNYIIKDEDGEDEKLEDIIKKESGSFYVYIPVSEKVTGIKLKLSYPQGKTEVSFWKKDDETEDENEEDKYQPVIWITRTGKEDQTREVPVGKYDLALRKYIVEVDGEKLTGDKSREPKVDATGLTKGDKTAIYKHPKNAVEISKNSKITYELRVYNEGTTSAVVKKIKDFIPEGLELAQESKDAGWKEENGVATLEISDGVLNARDDDKLESGKDTLEGGLSTYAVRITLQVTDEAKAGSALTNIAEIADTNANDSDHDSTPNNFDKDGISDLPGYTGSGEQDGYYPGSEDDDDFDKVIIKDEKPTVDLALKKFITSVNGKELTGNDSREITVESTEPLKNGGLDANYTSSKVPLLVKKGDIVTYTIRVFNEGETDAYPLEIADFIPEGLGFINGSKVNVNNEWKLVSTSDAIYLKDIENAVKNAEAINGFSDEQSLGDLMVVKGKAEITSQATASTKLSAFDGSDKLSSTDIEVVCVVLADEKLDDNLKNFAEIIHHGTPDEDGNILTDEDGVKDRDSTPDSISKENKYGEDDDDDEDLTMKEEEYDLALQKFITAVDQTQITDRQPTVSYENGKITYNHSTNPQEVANGQLVEYTIRVYNEGTTDAYAAEVADDIPNGLEFVADNETNKKYNWKLFDANGNETTNVGLAKTVRTDYLSKENGEGNLLKGFDSSKPISTDSNNANPDFRDVKLVFRVKEEVLEKTTTTEKRIIINTAEITKETDSDGNDVPDIDSTPNNWKDGEDDIDKERVYVKYFDLALKKRLVKVIVMENGRTTEYNINDDTLFKVELNKKSIDTTVVKFVYSIVVTNEGEIEGYAKEVKDYIPQGLEFIAADNAGWYNVGDNVVATDALANTLLQPKESASVNITLKWINGQDNLNRKVNVAEISKHENPYNSNDIDSTPDNKVPGEDDIDDAPVLLSVSTGSSQSYYGLIVAVAVIMTTGIVLIKKYVL